MAYELGVDVGGTFTDVLLVDVDSGLVHMAKVPSTPEDSSVGVLNGIARVCESAGVDAGQIGKVTHGTTVATNAILTGRGARVGLVTTAGYGQMLQIARSFVPGGLGGWVVYNKSEPLAPHWNVLLRSGSELAQTAILSLNSMSRVAALPCVNSRTEASNR